MRRIDLRPIQDDKRVLRNPHKGWYRHYIDNGYGRIRYRDPKIHPPGDYMRDLPGLNHLYLRIDWSDIEAKKDVYDWSYVDAIMKEWSAQGYRFAFRVCCYEGDPALPYATPKWLRDLGCTGTDVKHEGWKGAAWEPDYGDPIFLEGKLDYSSWEDKDGGGKRSKLAVIANNFQFVGSKRDDSAGAESSTPDTNAEIPF